MRLTHFPLVLLAFWASSDAARAVIDPAADVHGLDLARIPRRLLREPNYNTKPKYCLLAFGPLARTRVWLVQDGDVLYVDRNGNGDLTEAGERIECIKAVERLAGIQTSRHLLKAGRAFAAGDIIEADGANKHTQLWVRNAGEFSHVSIRIGGECYQYTGEDAWSFWELPKDLRFAARPQDAPVIHFRGPLTMRLLDRSSKLTAGTDAKVEVVVGSPGLGAGTFAVFKPDFTTLTAWPVAQVESQEEGAKLPAAPYLIGFETDACCIVYSFQGTMRIPDRATSVRLSLRFPRNAVLDVKPQIVDVPLGRPE